MNAILYAQQMIDSGKYVETGGQNRGPYIDHLCKEFGYDPGTSWCGLFVSAAFLQSVQSGEKGDPFHYTAGSQDLLAWFKKYHTVSKNADDLLHWLGALAIRTDPGGLHGHVTMVAQRFTTADNHVTAIRTCEGNTNMNGGSNGDRAWNHRRPIPLAPYEWTFCRTDNIAGGKWWE